MASPEAYKGGAPHPFENIAQKRLMPTVMGEDRGMPRRSSRGPLHRPEPDPNQPTPSSTMDWKSGIVEPRDYGDYQRRGPDDPGPPKIARDRRIPTLNRENLELAREMQYNKLLDLSDMVREMGLGSGNIRFGRKKQPGVQVGEEYMTPRETYLLIDNIQKTQLVDEFVRKSPGAPDTPSFGNRPVVNPGGERPPRQSIAERFGR